MEHWRPIVGWKGLYEVSDHGRVRSLARKIRCRGLGKRKIPRRLMKLHQWRDYKVVWLRRDGSIHQKYRVHRLVATAFIPNPNHKDLVNHKNRIRNDNRIENLEWVTHSENTQHWIDHNKKESEKNASQFVKETMEHIGW